MSTVAGSSWSAAGLAQRIHERILLAEQELRGLHAALQAFDQAMSAPGSVRPRRRVRTPQRPGRRVTAGEVLAAIPADGVSRAQIAARTGGSDRSVLAALRALEATGLARREGERRGVRWHRTTEQPRIAAGDDPISSGR